MQKKIFISAVLVIIILLAGATLWAFQRGVLSFEEGSWIPTFSKTAIAHPTPALDRPITYPADFSVEARTIFDSNLAKLKERLTANTADHEAWLDLAIYYRMVGDYDGAVEIWEYLRAIKEDDGISRRNLGEHYFHSVKDYPKAEAYYRESISVAPQLEISYTDLYEMYRYVYKKESTAAVDILKEALQNISGPSQVQFSLTLGRHYRDVLSDRDTARKYLTEARAFAVELKDTNLVRSIDKELAGLR